MIRGLRLFVAATILAVCLGATAGTVYTSSIGVTAPLVYSKSHTIAIGELVPANCSPIAASIDSIANGASNSALWGTLGGGSNTVWLWNAQNQTTTSGGGALNGGNGADCMVPGGVRSGVTLTVGGGKGADYCYGGPGPGGYAANSCNNASLFGTPYATVTTSNPAFA